jgi:peptide/nickel transport system substrate-binding protein
LKRPWRSKRGLLLAGAVLVLGAGLFVAGAPGGSVREGGTFKIAGALDAIDPALALGESAYVLEATCAQLLNHPDKASPAGTRAVPEVAAAYPSVSDGGKTYTFTVRDGFRFSTGEKVTAASFAHAINRVLSPTMKSPSVQSMLDIVGAQAVLDGKATEASGVKARGNKLIVRLNRAAGDFPARVTQFPFCAVPQDLPVDPEGVGAPFPSAGPYYVSEFVPGEKFVLERNSYYRGSRPHHVDEFDGIAVPDAVAAVKSGVADFADLGPSDLVGLGSKYRSQLHLVPGAGLRMVVLNSARPLFKDNVPLRQAVNFAIERRALIRARGAISGVPTDQYLFPSIPGFVDASVYPLGRPNLATAKALAKGRLGSGVAVLYIKDSPDAIAQAQILERDLEPLGIVVKTKKFPGPALFQRLFTPGTPWDITFLGIGVSYYDPYELLNLLFDGRLIGTLVSSNLAHFNSPKYNALLTAASRLTGPARYRAYGKLDVDLARNAAPVAVYLSENASTFVSKRVGCLVLRPWLDLAAVCLK